MGSALFRWEACEADAAVDTFTFLAECPTTPQFRLKHAAVGQSHDAESCEFRFYSRYVFLHVFTALQLLLALFTLYLFNYLGTVRHHYAPLLVLGCGREAACPRPRVVEARLPHRREALAAAYLAIVVLGMCFTAFAAAYIAVSNSAWWVSLELARWERDQRARMRQEYGGSRHDAESSGCRLRRLGVRWISWTRPYYHFPPRHLPDFDYRHDLHARFGARATRRNPKKVFFLLAAPFVFALAVMDIVTVDEMRVTGVRVSLLQGLLLVAGPLFLLSVVWLFVSMLCKCWRACNSFLLGL
ncbi:uncharacterized protein Tco025E_03435 [Trypanosoma conorhini]|uniref:Uncharacterized protein n=1 Tax=Trypanosoma conorhini TaxID=83891 RepID=A0A422PUB4_9TRYP|nr:uncharacterized protein Tco025E_03435 [Trypanosoma conorhini]RNF21355.1 hypothetical protein Tco025E_03435 [Trypanosoma conorhini]